jgi:abortive infection bacteriophage resistance protein
MIKITGLPAPLRASVMWPRGDIFNMAQLKLPTTYSQQLDKLRSRGCQVSDVPLCEKILSRMNYYRLSAYFLPFKKADGNYLPGTDFNSVYQIYEFDRKLRSLLFAAIEEVEIYLRAKFAYYHAHKYGVLGYMDADNYNDRHNHERFKKLIESEIKNNSKVQFVQHHNTNYEGQFPVWVITEIFTFGMLSYFYADLPVPDKKQIAKTLFGTIPKNLTSWLRCCTDLRNICAHYGRLYFRTFTAIPANITGLRKNMERRLFGAILALKALYPDTDKWNTEIQPTLCHLVNSYSNVINLEHIGFPTDWNNKTLKQASWSCECPGKEQANEWGRGNGPADHFTACNSVW